MRISDWSSDVCSSDLLNVFTYRHGAESVSDVCVEPAADDADGFFRMLLDDFGDLLDRGGAHAPLHLVEVDHLVDLAGDVLAGAAVVADPRRHHGAGVAEIGRAHV